MAECNVCGAAEGDFMLIPPPPAETMNFCPPCFARFGLNAAKEMLPPEEIADQLGPMFVQGGATEGGGGKRKRGAKAPEPAPEPEPEPGPAPAEASTEESATASDG